MHRLCIIGSGITGAAIARFLKEKLPDINVTVLEKARGAGGRMCTSRSPLGSSLDLGAQFISKTSKLSDIQKICYSELVEASLLRPLQGTIEGLKSASSATEHFVCPEGSGSIVKYFLHTSGYEVLFEHKVTKISKFGDKWKITCDNNTAHEFDSIVSTVPIPQVLQLDGVISQIPEECFEKLKKVEYCSRIALGLYFDKNPTFFDNLSWVAKFILEDSMLRFISIDHRKRNYVSSLPTLVIHTTKEFGKEHIDNDTNSVQNLILDRLQHLLPGIPKPSHVKYHKWRYSQIEKSYSNQPGCLTISKSPLFICAGDGFSNSTFDGCIYSAENAVKNIIGNINSNTNLDR